MISRKLKAVFFAVIGLAIIGQNVWIAAMMVELHSCLEELRKQDERMARRIVREHSLYRRLDAIECRLNRRLDAIESRLNCVKDKEDRK